MLLNIILVSIPEILFMVLLVILIMRRYDLLDKYTINEKLQTILIKIVIPDALITSYILFGWDINSYLRVFINIGVFNLLVMIVLFEKKDLILVFFASLVSFGTVVITEVITTLILIYVFNIDLKMINSSAIINFIIIAPGRLFQYSIIYIIYLKKNFIMKINIINIWKSNAYFRKLSSVYLIINILIPIYIYNSFALKKYLSILDMNIQMAVIMLIFILFILLIIMPLITLYSLYPSEKLRNKFE